MTSEISENHSIHLLESFSYLIFTSNTKVRIIWIKGYNKKKRLLSEQIEGSGFSREVNKLLKPNYQTVSYFTIHLSWLQIHINIFVFHQKNSIHDKYNKLTQLEYTRLKKQLLSLQKIGFKGSSTNILVITSKWNFVIGEG